MSDFKELTSYDLHISKRSSNIESRLTQITQACQVGRVGMVSERSPQNNLFVLLICIDMYRYIYHILGQSVRNAGKVHLAFEISAI